MRKARLITFVFNVCVILMATNIVLAGGGTIDIPSEVEHTLTKITSILLLIASAVCIGKIIHIGLKFVTASAVEKSQAKEALMPWIIGTIVCFGSATIGSAIIKLFTEAGAPTSVLDY